MSSEASINKNQAFLIKKDIVSDVTMFNFKYLTSLHGRHNRGDRADIYPPRERGDNMPIIPPLGFASYYEKIRMNI